MMQKVHVIKETVTRKTEHLIHEISEDVMYEVNSPAHHRDIKALPADAWETIDYFSDEISFKVTKLPKSF